MDYRYASAIRVGQWVTQKAWPIGLWLANFPRVVKPCSELDKVSITMWWDKIRNFCEQRRQLPINPKAPHPQALGREGGQSLIEFAFILPLLLLVVLGTVDLGMGFKTYIALTNAAREGVRWISIHPTDQAGAEDRIAEEAERVGLMDGILIDDGYSVIFTPDQSNYAAGEKVTVSIEYDYELLFGAITGLPEIPFTASSTMVVLYDE